MANMTFKTNLLPNSTTKEYSLGSSTNKWKIFGDLTGNADTATKFAANQSITLTGDVTGSISSQAGWSINTTIGSGKVTNDMLAGSIINDKLTNSKVTIAGNDVSLGGSLEPEPLRTSLGLSNAMHFIGITSTALSDGATTSTLTAKTANSLSKTTGFIAGDVVIDTNNNYEYVWSGSSWELLGGDSSYKVVQTAITDPTVANNLTSTSFISSISQNANGEITPIKANLPTASTTTAGIIKITKENFSSFVNTLDTAAAAPSDNEYYISQYHTDNSSSPLANTYVRRKNSGMYSYIKNKLLNDSAFVEKAGDTMTGPLVMGNSTQVDGAAINFISKKSDSNSTRTTWLGYSGGSNKLYLFDSTNNKVILDSDETGVSNFYGTATKATQDGDGNTISSTYVKKSGDTMTGSLYINVTSDTSGTTDTGAIVVGNKAAENIAIDSNEIMARRNEKPSILNLNHDGGTIYFGGPLQIKSSVTYGDTLPDTSSAVLGQLFFKSRAGGPVDTLVNRLDTLENSKVIDSSGSSYIKFANGIGICWGHAGTSAQATTQTGAIYTYTWNNVATFPFTFTSLPVVSVTPFDVVYSGILQNTFSTSGITKLIIWRPDSGNIYPNINYIAIGYWK